MSDLNLKEASKDSRSRNWLLTINNPSEEDLSQLKSICDLASYWVYQFERGEKEETDHLHCFVQFENVKRFGILKKSLPRARIDTVTRDVDTVVMYCKKLETRVKGPFEGGHRDVKKQGQRTDVAKLKESIRSGKRITEIFDSLEIDEYAKYHKMIRDVSFEFRVQNAPAIRDIKVELWWGVAGAGKTWKALQLHPDAYVWTSSTSGAWFDGYRGQKTIILDDFAPGCMPLNLLKRVLDRYRCQIAVKGSFDIAEWDHVIITSNYNYDQWYPDVFGRNQYELDAVKRRIHSVTFFDKVWSPGPIDQFVTPKCHEVCGTKSPYNTEGSSLCQRENTTDIWKEVKNCEQACDFLNLDQEDDDFV